MAEGLGTKVELTLLVGHETGCSKEARSDREQIKSKLLKELHEHFYDSSVVSWTLLTWQRRTPASQEAAGVHLDKRSSAFYWGPIGSLWHHLQNPKVQCSQNILKIMKLIVCDHHMEQEALHKPSFQQGWEWGLLRALYQISCLQPSYAHEYSSSPIP